MVIVLGNNRFVLKCKDGTFLDNPQIDGLKVDFFGIDNSIIIEEGGGLPQCAYQNEK